MPLQVVGPGETSVADLASEGSLPGVLSHVCLQVVLQVEPTAADVAHEGPLLCVCFNVSLQFRPGLEGQITSSALELKRRGLEGVRGRGLEGVDMMSWCCQDFVAVSVETIQFHPNTKIYNLVNCIISGNSCDIFILMTSHVTVTTPIINSIKTS